MIAFVVNAAIGIGIGLLLVVLGLMWRGFG
jgi:hypothetical protein